ncbi:hypothetical protein [Natronomonas halophila]|uniref:hypothetical protein n=1 Tax=Natronomonas halophila TaxID=2747817 RepID=UPI001BA84B6C|nr:hypothetical protein [Natronomonas halophila]
MDDSDGMNTATSTEDVLARVFRSSRTNAILAWLLVAVLAAVFVETVWNFDRLWMAFVATTAAIVLLPPVAHRDWQVMLPWELLVLALLPILARANAGGELGLFAYYLSIAALALLITVELHMFTRLQMTHWFAILFVVMATMASTAAWTVVRWNMDRTFGTDLLGDLQERGADLLPPGHTAQEAANAGLMVEWVYVALAGVAAGVLFDAYFKRRGHQLRRRLRSVIRR